jgi:flagellar motor switch protein FliN
MSSADNLQELRLDASEHLRSVLDGWAASLAEVFESMAGQRPEVRWRPASGSMTEIGIPTGPGAEEEVLWWEQPFSIVPEAVFWIAAPRAAWDYAGTLTLKAAGLETFELPVVKSTWFELLGQSLGSMARAAGALVGHEVTMGPGVERAPGLELREWGSVSLHFPETALAPLIVAMSPQMARALAQPGKPQAEPELPPEVHEPAEQERHPHPSQTMDLLMDVDLPVSISFGKAQLPLKDVLKLTTGSIVELNRGLNDQVEVLVNHCLIARGEVVVVEGNYGVRIQEIVKRQERLRSLQ